MKKTLLLLFTSRALRIFSELSSQVYLTEVETYVLLQVLMVGIWSHASFKEGLVVSCWKYTECLPFSQTGSRQQGDSSSALNGFLHRLSLPCHFPLHTLQSLAISFHLLFSFAILAVYMSLPSSVSSPSVLLFSYDWDVPSLHLLG